MHILVTGGTGFIGSALVPELVGRGHEVTIISRARRSAGHKVAYCQGMSYVGEKRVTPYVGENGFGIPTSVQIRVV